MTNLKIRIALAENRFAQWELAGWLGLSESTLFRLFRKELPDDIQEKILNVIDCVKNSKPYDNSFIRVYLRLISKRGYNRERTAEQYARYIERCLDEAERRRRDGGWDLSI